jgi:hypothetical protein
MLHICVWQVTCSMWRVLKYRENARVNDLAIRFLIPLAVRLDPEAACFTAGAHPQALTIHAIQTIALPCRSDAKSPPCF